MYQTITTRYKLVSSLFLTETIFRLVAELSCRVLNGLKVLIVRK